ncbi:expressed unknown protein [Seminavis robusta]|uniref:Uncharacterized protein n=1 Tax=Seminavis robusta TaxID=568900 RepID=A0A9N8DFH2_9STRA|nr:expressed unknown protein [Seminavis robusta]|eukprot:Sro132_g062620.1 n/a (565) ;mRNA; f:61374-63068
MTHQSERFLRFGRLQPRLWMLLVAVTVVSNCQASRGAASNTAIQSSTHSRRSPLDRLKKLLLKPTSTDPSTEEIISNSSASCGLSRRLQSLCSRNFTLSSISWNNRTAVCHFPALWGAVRSAVTNYSSTTIIKVSGPSAAAALALLAYKAHVAKTQRAVLPRYRNLQLLSAVTAVDNADGKTLLLLNQWLSVNNERNPPALVPIHVSEDEDEDILVLLWNGTKDNSKAVGRIPNGWYSTSSKDSSQTPNATNTNNNLGLYIQVSDDQIAVFVVANDVKKIVEELEGTDWVAYVNQLLPEYDKQRYCRRERVASEESTVKKFAWQSWLKHQLMPATNNEEEDSSLTSIFPNPGMYTFLYREAVKESELGNMLKRRCAHLLSKRSQITKPSIMFVQEPDENTCQNSTTDAGHRYCQRFHVEDSGRMWYGGLIPFRTRLDGWIVPVEEPIPEAPIPVSNSNNHQKYFSYRPPPSPPTLPPSPSPQRQLRIEWKSFRIQFGFSFCGLNRRKELTMEEDPWIVEKRHLMVSDCRSQVDDDDDDPLRTPTTRVLLLSRPRQGWSVWRQSL